MNSYSRAVPTELGHDDLTIGKWGYRVGFTFEIVLVRVRRSKGLKVMSSIGFTLLLL